MSAKKPSKKSPGKKPSTKASKELKEADLDTVVGGIADVSTTSSPLDDEKLDMRKRPGRVKSLNS